MPKEINMQKLTPHLWFDKEAKEAAAFYTSVFGGTNSRVKSTQSLHDTPSGSVDLVSMELWGQEFGLMSAGPLFKFNPSISLLVACKSRDDVDALWKRLTEGGMPLIELGAYPFSERYGWTQDRYGLSWQVMFMGDHPIKQRIIPSFLFVDKVCGKAEEAIRFYSSVFRDSKVGDIHRYGKGEEPDKEGTVKYAAVTLEGQEFGAMDSARAGHNFSFNEAVSIIVNCDTQEQIDSYWGKLSAVPEAEQCGWLKDKYGVSWQIIPTIMGRMLQDKDPKKIGRLTQALLKMKKLDISALERAFS
jgi:predicted 3-demethylubiquinone-9 3-methyltransferase (glyoxalase superfamily)